MGIRTEGQRVLTRVLRRAARVWSSASIDIMSLFLLGEGFR